MMRCEVLDYYPGEVSEQSCRADAVAQVEPAPAGQFAPIPACEAHITEHCEEHAFHLGTRWVVSYLNGQTKTVTIRDPRG